MNDRDFWIGLIAMSLVSLLILAGYGYGLYRYGRFVERRLLTQLFTQMTQDTYYDGFGDGVKAEHSNHPACSQEVEEEDGRY